MPVAYSTENEEYHLKIRPGDVGPVSYTHLSIKQTIAISHVRFLCLYGDGYCKGVLFKRKK